jgi:hypothetical protein
MAVHKDAAKNSPPLKETKNPAEIKACAGSTRREDPRGEGDARPGDILTPEIRNKFRRLMYPVVAGPVAQGDRGKCRQG